MKIILLLVCLLFLVACRSEPEALSERTRTPTAEPNTPTAEPTVTPSEEATETAEPCVCPTGVATATITPTVGVTPTVTITPTVGVTPSPEEHDVTTWHEPMLFHHHGENPQNFHPILLEAVQEYWSQEIGSAWVSSGHENEFPSGDHAGFKNVSETETGCPQGRAGSDAPCINAYVIQFHAMGTMVHARKPIHSIKAALLICEDESFDSCGYVITGGWNEYVFLHVPYKNYYCGRPSDPTVDAEDVFQFPYTALPIKLQFEGTANERNTVFWAALGPLPIIQQEVLANRGYLPNQMLRVSWNEVDAWDQAVGFSPACLDPTEFTDLCEGDVNDASCRWNGTEFQVYDIQLHNLPTQRPFSGWTNRHGVVVTGCIEEGIDCVPLIISEGVPVEKAVFGRPVGPETAPILNYDDGTLLRKPPFTLDD